MRFYRFPPVLLLVVGLYTSANDRVLAGAEGDANEDVPVIATPEEAATRGAAYEARVAARAATDRGFALGQAGDFDGSRRKFSEAIEFDPGFAPAYHLRAAACMKLSDWTQATVDLDTLIALDPNHAELFNERGYARRQLGDLQGARADFDRCLTLGTNALAYANRAEVEAMLGEEDAAAADLAVARSLARDMPIERPTSVPRLSRKTQIHHAAHASRASNNTK